MTYLASLDKPISVEALTAKVRELAARAPKVAGEEIPHCGRCKDERVIERPCGAFLPCPSCQPARYERWYAATHKPVGPVPPHWLDVLEARTG